MPLLSICIPTYNRSNLLEECIKSIFASSNKYLNDIEIIVSDNASTDDTEVRVAKLQRIYQQIKYHKNKTNVIDKNFFISAGLASGDYIWVFGDDDKMELIAIGQVLEKIRAGYNLIVVNHSIWLEHFSVKFKDKVVPFKNDMIFNDHNKLLSILGPRLGFISSVIIKKEKFSKISSSEYNPFLKYGFAFLFSIYAAVNQDCYAYFIAEPLVRQTGSLKASDISIWYKIFAKGSSLVFEELHQKGYSRQAVRSAKYLVLRDYVMHDISFRKRKGEGLNGIFGLILPFYKNLLFFWVVIVPALFAPRILVLLTNRMAKKVCGKN